MTLTSPELLAFILTTAAVMAIPGVTVSSLVGTTLGHGLRAGFVMEVGAVLARISMLILLIFGLDAVSRIMASAFDWVKIAGALYLIWLGVRMIRKPPRVIAVGQGTNDYFRQIMTGFIVLWTNPKALLFFGAFVPQFVDVNQPIAPQVVFLGALWIAIVVIADAAYILLAGGARNLFVGRFSQRAGWVSGAVLICAGLWLAFQQKA